MPISSKIPPTPPENGFPRLRRTLDAATAHRRTAKATSTTRQKTKKGRLLITAAAVITTCYAAVTTASTTTATAATTDYAVQVSLEHHPHRPLPWRLSLNLPPEVFTDTFQALFLRLPLLKAPNIKHIRYHPRSSKKLYLVISYVEVSVGPRKATVGPRENVAGVQYGSRFKSYRFG